MWNDSTEFIVCLYNYVVVFEWIVEKRGKGFGVRRLKGESWSRG
jgi:hypothetical protein